MLGWLFGKKKESASDLPAWTVPDGSSQGDYLKACLQPAFREEKEERSFRSDHAFGVVLDRLNSQQYADAIRVAERVLPRFPDFDLPYKWLASAYRSTDQLQRSRAVLSQGLGKARRKCLLLTDMGETEWRAGSIHQAVYWWCQALHCLASNPIDYNAFLLLANVAKGCGLAHSERRLLSRVDAMQGGQVRLDLTTADRLTSLVRGNKTAALASAVEQIEAKYGLLIEERKEKDVCSLVKAIRDEYIQRNELAEEYQAEINRTGGYTPLGGSDAIGRRAEAIKTANITENAAKSLTNMGAPAVETIVASLTAEAKSSDWHVRSVLGRDTDWRVRESLGRTLGEVLRKIADPRAFELLIAGLKDVDKNVRFSIASALATLGDPRAVDSLTVALKDEDKDVRIAAESAMKEIRETRSQ